MREVVLDTETSGASARNGDRVVEIGMVELIDGQVTGRIFHEFIDPGSPIHFAAHKVHGLSNENLVGQPFFEQISQEARAFIGSDMVLAQNAKFDREFMNAEFARSRVAIVEPAMWFDTINLFRQHFTGSMKLDTVIDRLGIRTPDRTIHGALLDTAILAAAVARLRGHPDVDIDAIVSAGNEGRVKRDKVTGWVKKPRAAKPVRPHAIPVETEAQRPAPAVQNQAVLEAIERVNAIEPGQAVHAYADLRSGRDEWTTAQPDMIIKTGNRLLSGFEAARWALDSLDDRPYLATMRWICRGLRPDHAICMLVSLEKTYDREIPPRAAKVAEWYISDSPVRKEDESTLSLP